MPRLKRTRTVNHPFVCFLGVFNIPIEAAQHFLPLSRFALALIFTVCTSLSSSQTVTHVLHCVFRHPWPRTVHVCFSLPV